MGKKSKTEFTLGQRIVLAIVPRVVWALLSVVGRTWRYEVIAEEDVDPVLFGQRPGPEIYCFWHQCVLPCTMYFRHALAVILISRSFDGELITRILRMFSFDAVRGSSSRGGREGLVGLSRVIESGRTAIFTADGPRGPIYQTKMGPIKLAQMTGAPSSACASNSARLSDDETCTATRASGNTIVERSAKRGRSAGSARAPLVGEAARAGAGRSVTSSNVRRLLAFAHRGAERIA